MPTAPRWPHKSVVRLDWLALWVALSITSSTSVGYAQSPSTNPSIANAAKSTPAVRIAFNTKGQSRDELGEVIVESQDSGKLLLTGDGRLWLIQPSEITSQSASDKPLEVLSSEKIAADLRAQLPAGFLMYKTPHFVLLYNTSETYARWVGDLYERLYKGFHNYWDKRGYELKQPRFPLVALVFDSRDAYLQYARPEVNEAAAAMIGYYNQETNRIVSFDITGIQGLAQPGQRYSSRDMLTQLFSQPQAERTVATIVHEAVHQIAFNSGLQVRLADNPKWVSEGLAMFFEAPDSNPKGWGTIGKINVYQLGRFRAFLASRPADSLTTLISDDKRFADGNHVIGAYAESWALTYYLLKAQESEYVAYMKDLAKLPPLGDSTPRERVDLFKRHFGDDMSKLDKAFVNFMRRQR